MAGPFTLDDEEHEALDTLDELAVAETWVAARLARPGDREALREVLKGAVTDLGETLDSVEEAALRARAAFSRILPEVALRVIEAARTLALTGTPDAGELSIETLERARAVVTADPSSAASLGPAIEITGRALGLQRSGVAWGELMVMGESGAAAAAPALVETGAAILDRIAVVTHATDSQGTSSETTPSTALRIFRSALMLDAGPDLQARALATDHPEHADLARAMVAALASEGISSAATLVGRFDNARELREQNGSPTVDTDGPKRKFTLMHLALAVLVLGLTVWHYWLR